MDRSAILEIIECAVETDGLGRRRGIGEDVGAGVSMVGVVQLLRSALICSVRVRHGVLVMIKVARPSEAREMPPKLGVAGNAVGMALIVLFSNATAPFCDKARPSSDAPPL